jgi:teichuronic acid exporter
LGEQVTIREKVLASLPWALLETASSAVLGVVSVFVLGRLLRPAEFGVAALALAVGQYGDLIIDSLLTGGVIQRPQLSERALDTAFWLSIALGGAAALGCWSASGPIARFYERPELAGYVTALGMSALLTGASLMPRAVLARQLSLRSLSVRALVSRLLAVASTVALAIAGYGAWAIIAGTLVSGLSTAILSWSAGVRRPHLQFSPAACREFLAFGWPIAGQELLWSAVNRVFPLLVGLYHGADAVGYLNFAAKLVEPVAGILGASAYRIGLPMFSALQADKPALKRAFRSASRYSFAFVAPALVGLAAVAPDAVPLLFGNEWRPAIPIVEIFALVTACAVIAGAVATQRAGITIVALVWSARLVFSFPVGIRQLWQTAQVTAGEQVKPFIGPSLACAGMFLAVRLVRHFVSGFGLVSFAATLPTGIATYLLLMLVFDRTLLTQVLTLLRFGSAGRSARAA